MRRVFETPGPVTLVLRVPSGELDVEAVDTIETTVEIDADDELLREARVEERRRGGGHEIVVDIQRRRSGFGFEIDPPRVSFGFFRGGDIRVRVSVPTGARVDLESGSADVRARGRFGEVDATVGSGDFSLEEALEDATVKTGSGDVEIRRIGGRARVQSASGDVHVDAVNGPAEIRSASGDVHVREAGADLTVQTASGDQEIGAVAAGSVTLQSASGDIAVGIRRGSRVWIDARSMAGETSSELEVEDAPPLDDGSPLVEVRATAMSGDITLVRA